MKYLKYVAKHPLFLVLPLLLAACGNSGPGASSDSGPAITGGKEGNGKVSPYPFAEEMEEFTDMAVLVQDGEETQGIQLYSIATNPKRNFPTVPELLRPAAVAMFDMKGTITVAVTYPKGIESAVVRPARAGITPTVEGNTLTFDIHEWGQYSVEFNDDPTTDNLLIFANPPVEEPPADATIFSGRQVGMLNIRDNETVYMEPGSVIRGKVTMGSNSKLMGRGILTQGGPAAIEVHYQNNVTVDGIAILDPNRWVVEFRGCNDIHLENVKVLSSRDNSDGITIQSSWDMTIHKSFVRSWDDGIVLKNYTRDNCYNIKVTDCVLWTDLAQTTEIGFETNKGSVNGFSPSPNTDPQIYDIVFEDIDVIHAYHKAPISIHNADSCRVYNITFKNFIIDNAQMGLPGEFGEGGGWNYLIDFANGNSGDMGGDPSWTNNDGDREIQNVLVENVWVLGGDRSSCSLRLLNVDSGGTSIMEDVQLNNIYFEEEPIDYSDIIQASGLAGKVTQTNAPYFSWNKE